MQQKQKLTLFTTSHSSLNHLAPEMIENLFLATNKETKTQKIDINNNNNIARNKYCYEGSSSLSSEWKYKEHWYKDLDYFNC